MNSKEFPIAKRPGEYLAFTVLQMSTKMDGPAYIYLAIDAFSEFAFQLGVDRNDNPETVLKYIFQLTENPEFNQTAGKGFTLVFDKYEELSKQINALIIGMNGKLLYDKRYNNLISMPVLKSLSEYLIRDKM